MTSFNLEQYTGPLDASRVAGYPISSMTTAPTAGQTMTLNGAGTQWIFTSPWTLNSAQTISGNVTYTGTTKIGANGSPINLLQYGNVSVGNINATTNATASVTFPQTFATIPIVQGTAVVTTSPTDAGVVVSIATKSATAVTFNVFNTNAAPVTGVTVDWIAAA